MNRNPFKLPAELLELWEGMAQPAAIHTEDVCILANEPFIALFDYLRPGDVEGRAMGEFLSPWPPGPPKLGTRTAMGRRKGGAFLDIEITCLPCLYEGRILYQSIIRDISELKSWEGRVLQSERLTAMGKLAGEIAHEINNPLGGILLYGNLIREDLPKDSQALDNLEKVLKLATRCRIIAKGLLNFGRSSSRAFAPVDLNYVVREMLSMVRDHQILRQVNIHLELTPDLPHFMGDKGQIEQVALNLIINAGEAMHGEGRLFVETGVVEDPRCIFLRVTDSGPGIPEEIQTRIFEPFFTTKQAGRGTGLGLSITHGIVQRHGGRISVHSLPGEGTCFEVLFPAGTTGRTVPVTDS